MLRLFLAVVFASIAAAAPAQVPAGGEFQVNTITTGQQGTPRLAATGDGDFVVAWEEEEIYAGVLKGRRYAPNGTPRTGDIDLGPYAPGPALHGGLGEVVTDRMGNFAVAALSYDSPGSYRVVLRRFNSAGAPLGGETLVGEPGRFADAAISSSGEFVVAWERGAGVVADVYARRVNALGMPVGAEFLVNTYTTGGQRYPAVAMDGQGAFVVVWNSDGQDGDGRGVFGQRFDASGARLGEEFRVNTYTSSDQGFPDVSAAPDGRYVVVWSSYGQDGWWEGVFGQRFGAAGSPEGGEFQVNTFNGLAELAANVAVDAAGNFAVVWKRWPLAELYAQRFSAFGVRRGLEFRLNTYTTGEQHTPRLASDAQGNLLAAWVGLDGDGGGIFAQRFGGLIPDRLVVDTSGNGVLEPGESVDVRPSWRNANGAVQTFGGAAAAFTGPAPAVYTITDGASDYGTLDNGSSAQCTDCYGVAVPTTTRPLLHWDATLQERITPDALGQEKAWSLHLGASFADVEPSSPHYRFIETLFHRSVTGGCAAAEYCPGASTAREQMAVLVLVGREGPGYRPAECGTPAFQDVPAASPFCPFIEELARRGVVAGCGGGYFCPTAPVSREQMAVFVLRALDGALDPPACTSPMFGDVPASSPFCRWIEELARRGVVTGCGGGNYCPQAPVARDQMAVFISATFGLTLYGP